ncbi:MAG: hypothetical protein JWM59_5011 [Verrucomicrobiales bacterium]|nr:hypothetical protein [Verrucomicrobiales bacterium]
MHYWGFGFAFLVIPKTGYPVKTELNIPGNPPSHSKNVTQFRVTMVPQLLKCIDCQKVNGV